MSVAGKMTLGKLDMNRFTEDDAAVIPSSPASSESSSMEMIRFDGRIEIDTLIYDTYLITQGKTNLSGTLGSLKLSQLQGEINDTRFQAEASFSDMHKYLDGTAPLSGTIDCRLDKVYANKWISSDESAGSGGTAAATEYVALPGDMNLDITFRADEAHYDNIDIRNPRGKLALHDQMLEVLDFKGEAMGGTMSFSGIYNTQNINQPAFNLKYDMSSLSFTEAFKEVELFQTLAPVAKFIQGIFNSTLVMEGRLGEGYMPDLNSLAAAGFLETISGNIDQAQILEKLSQFLNLKKPLKIDLGKTRNWFEVKDGFVIMQEMDKNFDDIEMAFGGKHQIKGDMDYLIKLNLPADRVTANPVGALAKTGYEQLQQKASEYGVKLNTIDRFIVHVSIKGKLTDPIFSLKLFDASGKTLKDSAADQLTQIKEQVKDTLTALGSQVVQQAKDTLKSKFDSAADSARIVAEQKLKEATKDLVNQATGKLDSTLRDSLASGILDKVGSEVLGDKAGKEVDKLKDALDKWDPLKKKKKE
jgi:hypothetical protein